MKRERTVLMLGFDAADAGLIERWMADGTLPRLAELRARGAFGRLASSAEWLAGSPWPTFFTGTTPADHGFYHYLQWRADSMGMARPDPGWLPALPFWRLLGPSGIRAAAVDVPMAYAPERFDGAEICGWATHDRLAPPSAWPPDLFDRVRRRFGEPPMKIEEHRLLTARERARERDRLIESTRWVRDAAADLLDRERWDLFIAVFGAPHRGGHILWGPAGWSEGGGVTDAAGPSADLREVYRSCDAAAGALLDRAGGDATVLAFSLHGMGPNQSRSDLLPEMLSRVLAGPRAPEAAPARAGLLKRMRRAVPERWRHAVKSRLPSSWQDRLTAFWRMGASDWSATRAFGLVADQQGYIRINRRDREAAGIVAGEEFDRLRAEIAEGLSTFADADTGEPAVESVARGEEVFPEGPRSSDLPDLIVQWTPGPSSRHRALSSPRYGSIRWPVPGKNPDGRSGNHRPEGFLIAAGPGIAAGSEVAGAHILDLAPTVLSMLGVPPLPGFRGRPIDRLLAAAAPGTASP